MKIRVCAAVFCLMLGIQSARAADLATWSAANADCKARLVKLLEGSPNFRAAFWKYAEQSPDIVREWVAFLAEKGDRNTGDFVDKKGKAAKRLGGIHDDYADQMKGMREAIRDHPESMKSLFEDPATFRALCDEVDKKVSAKKAKKK